MRKIKKFKIPIYTYDILRKAKKRKIDLFALGLADQESSREYVSSLAAALEPSTVFDLLAPEDELAKSDGHTGNRQVEVEAKVEQLQIPALPLPSVWMAGTLGVFTLGASFEEKLKTITDPGLFALAETAALVFAETGLRVITELIGQEVSAEGLDPGIPRYVFAYPEPETEELPTHQTDEAALAAVLARLSADKIGVTMREGVVTPKYSLIFSIPWLVKRKKKPAAGPAAAGK